MIIRRRARIIRIGTRKIMIIIIMLITITIIIIYLLPRCRRPIVGWSAWCAGE